MRKESVLIVEDEEGIRSLICLFLKKKGYDVLEAENGFNALAIVTEENPDVILLDIEMPGMDGFEVCKHIRKQSKVPILFISCKKDATDKMNGFSMGADDYITKPFDFYELEARIQALLRRNEWAVQDKRDADIIKNGDLKIDIRSCEVFIGENPIKLLHKEYQLLVLLAQNPNRIWTAEQLYDHIWGYYSDGTPQTVKVHISNLRRKLNEPPGQRDYIQTMRGFGYRFLAK